MNLGYVTIVMSMRMIMLGLCVGSAINEILRNHDSLPMYPYVNARIAKVRSLKCSRKPGLYPMLLCVVWSMLESIMWS